MFWFGPQMTYNFDPDRWYENQRLALDAKRDRGDLTDEATSPGSTTSSGATSR